MAQPSAQPPDWMMKIVRFIDKYVGELSGQIFYVLIFPMVGGLTYETVESLGVEL